MSYREDIEANFDITYPNITLAEAKIYLEDIYIMAALSKLLRVRCNQFQTVVKQARDEYTVLHPEVEEMGITIENLGEVNSKIPEWYRQLYSFESGTLSSKIRDAKDKVEQEIEKRIIMSVKGE